LQGRALVTEARHTLAGVATAKALLSRCEIRPNR
jgi:hypothetical protein